MSDMAANGNRTWPLRQWRDSERRGWPSGPWDTEPDGIQWMRGGYRCEIVRSATGAWLGYVYIRAGHPWNGLHYDSLPSLFDGRCLSKAAPEVDDAGEPTGCWVVGFHCDETSDLAPLLPALHRRNPVYRDQAYAVAMTENLARLAHDAELHKANPDSGG